jgi:GAF domain-containing protein
LIVASAVETMQAKAACLWLTDEASGEFVAVAYTGLSDEYFKLKLLSQKIVDVLSKEGYLHARDATTDPRLEAHDAKKKEGVASLLMVPVRVEDRIIGELCLYTSETRDFTNEEIEFLRAMADQGGIAIDNARLLERMQKNTELFLNLTSNINSSLDIRKVLHILTEETCEALGMKGVSIRLLNQDDGNLELVASYGLSEAYLNKGPVSAEKSLSDALKGQTVVIADVANDKRLQYRQETLAEGISSMVCVPIKSKEEIIGVMRLCAGGHRAYPEDFLILVNALAHAGALAIQNASMYLVIQQDKKSLEEDIWSYRSYF